MIDGDMISDKLNRFLCSYKFLYTYNIASYVVMVWWRNTPSNIVQSCKSAIKIYYVIVLTRYVVVFLLNSPLATD